MKLFSLMSQSVLELLWQPASVEGYDCARCAAMQVDQCTFSWLRGFPTSHCDEKRS